MNSPMRAISYVAPISLLVASFSSGIALKVKPEAGNGSVPEWGQMHIGSVLLYHLCSAASSRRHHLESSSEMNTVESIR